jgi:hypothetical protein
MARKSWKNGYLGALFLSHTNTYKLNYKAIEKSLSGQ